MDLRTLWMVSLVLLATTGCGGSSNGSGSTEIKTGTPTGGGGKVADYVGSYSGAYSTVPNETQLGTVSFAVALDGSVAGTRHVAATNLDQPLTGSIDKQGLLTLTRPGTNVHGEANIFGYLAKQAGGKALATLVEDDDHSEVQNFSTYRLTGGLASAGSAPLTTGKWLSGAQAGVTPFRGSWRGENDSESGKLSIRIAPSGATSGTFTDSQGAVRKATGVVYNDADVDVGQGFAGILTVGGRTLEVRLVPVSSGPTFVGLTDLVGTASTPDGTESDTLSLRLVE